MWKNAGNKERVLMHKMRFALVLLVIVCALSVSALPAGMPWPQVLRFDPLPNPLNAGISRPIKISSYTMQIRVLDWVDFYRYEAVYDAQGRMAATVICYWDDALQAWNPHKRLEYSYRPDGRPLHVDWFDKFTGEWVLLHSGNWYYQDGRLERYCLYRYSDGSELPFYSLDYAYDSATGRLDRITESWFAADPVNPGMNAYEYEWDSQGRPAIIREYNKMGNQADWSLNFRRLITHCPEDQSTYAEYLGYLEHCYPFDRRFVAGINPFLVEQELIQVLGGQYWFDLFHNDYLYHPDLRLDMKQYWMVYSTADSLESQVEYGYDNGLVSSETLYYARGGRHDLRPSERLIYEYTEVADDGDAAIPSLVRSITLSPNPIPERTTVSFELDRPGLVRIGIYNLRGQLVRCLVEGWRGTGIHRLDWDGTDGKGRRLSAGIYLLKLDSGVESRMAKAILLQ